MILNEHKKRITESKDIAEIMTLVLSKEEPFDQQKEHFWVIGVNQRNVIQYIELVSLGTLTSSVVHPREVFRSGELEVSPEDLRMQVI